MRQQERMSSDEAHAMAATSSPSASASSSCRLRIVCLSQGATDAIHALGLQGCLVGRSHECTGPSPLLALPCVSSREHSTSPVLFSHDHANDKKSIAGYNVNWELLEELKPDLIFTQTQIRADAHLPLHGAQQVVGVNDRTCRVVSLQSHTVEDVFQNLETIANCCGVGEEGAKLISVLRTQWKMIKQKTPQWADGMPRVNVACLSCVNPLVGAGYWIPEIISCAGGLSLCGTVGCPSNSLTLGDLMQRNPDVIIYLCRGLHVGSLARELSWLVASKEWRKLKAIKANRFFLVDANRFFIDSGPNVILSAELMAETLHGFGHGHEGKGFLRWKDCAVAKDTHAGENPVQQSKFAPNERMIVGNEDLHSKHINIDKHEVLKESLTVNPNAHNHHEYVTNVYEIKKPVVAEKHEQDRHGAKAKPDIWDKNLGVVEAKQKDIQDNLFGEKLDTAEVEAQRCLQAKIIRQVTPDADLTIPKLNDGDAVIPSDFCRKWPKPVKEMLPCKPARTQSTQKTMSSINSFFAYNHKESMEEKRPVQVFSLSKASVASSRNLSKQASFDKNASSVVFMQEKLAGKDFHEQELISKVWASTQSAAQAKNCSMPSMSKAKVLKKSSSLPVSHGSLECKTPSADVASTNTGNVSAYWKNLPQKTISPSNHNGKPLLEGPLTSQPAKVYSRSFLSVPGEGANQFKRTQLSTVERHVGRCSSELFAKKQSFNAAASSLTLEVMPRKARILRDSVLKSLVDLQSADCLLLSGGLASSILAEAVPLVHSKGFKLGFTVLAGPAATDRASAELLAKCKGMEHVIIGEREKGSAVFLVAKELAFVVETLKTFDPVQIRSIVPIAAALREAKSRGFEYVVTGDGLDELLSRDGTALNDVQTFHLRISKVLSRSAVLLGKALGIKVLQPFLHPKLVEECKALCHTFAIGSEIPKDARSTLRQAFPEVSAACKEKGSNEVGSGMFYVSEYFSSTISASVLQNKAKRIYQKERICIRDAEHLVYYRAFTRVFKGKVPKGMARWESEPCSGCGYQLSSDMIWYCLVCGHSLHSFNNQVKQSKPEQSKEALQRKLSNLQSCSASVQKHLSCRLKGEIKNEKGANSKGIVSEGASSVNSKGSKELASVLFTDSKASIGNQRHDGTHDSKRFGTEKNHSTKGTQCVPGIGKAVPKASSGTKDLQEPMLRPDKEKKPSYFVLLGSGSAALLLLLQLLKR